LRKYKKYIFYRTLGTLLNYKSIWKPLIYIYVSTKRLFPFSTNISVDLGLLYMKQRDYDQAFNVLGNTLCQDPENPKALLTLAAEMQVFLQLNSGLNKILLFAYN